MAVRRGVYKDLGGAYITDIQITGSPFEPMRVDMSLHTDDKIANYFMRLFQDDLPQNNTMGLHLIENEFICIWCGSVNVITNKHCSQCGGPRGFLLNR